MHERGVAVDLVRTAGVVALGQGASRVRRLRIRVGRDSHLDPDALRSQVAWHAIGTICEGADIELEWGNLGVEGEGRDDRVQLVSIDVEERHVHRS